MAVWLGFFSLIYVFIQVHCSIVWKIRHVLLIFLELHQIKMP